MKKELVLALVVGAFGLGALGSAVVTATQDEPKPAFAPEVGQRLRITAHDDGVFNCTVQAVSRDWVQCGDGYWVNLVTFGRVIILK